MSKPILTLENVSKSFRSHWTFRPIQAVRNVSVEVSEGESFGFLGPNGAGKTSTIKCILGLVHLTAGRVLLDGEPLTSASQHGKIGYLPELPYFYEHLSVVETLDFFAALHGLHGRDRKSRVDSALDRVGLSDRKHAAVRSLSKGLQQRLGFAQAILNDPRLLILDEPFSGLDPSGRREMRELILDLKTQGTTIFMSSHILSDVEEICERVSIMSKGEILAVFALQDIPRLFGECYELSFLLPETAFEGISDICMGASHIRDRSSVQGTIRILQYSNSQEAQEALCRLSENGVSILQFHSLGLKLEDVFLKVTEAANNALSREINPQVMASAEGEL